MKTKRKIDISIGFVILVIILMFGLLILNIYQEEVLGLPKENYVSDNFELYFAPSQNSIDRFLEVIGDSEKEIHCSLRSLNFPPLEELFVDKESEGVKVRIYVDSDYKGNKRIYLPFVRFAPEGYSMMHNNYCILDEEIVITGSTIFNQNTIEYALHDFVIIDNEKLAKEYNSDFWRLYNNQSVEKNFEEKDFIEVNNETKVIPYFCPHEDCEGAIVELIENSKKSIGFAVYSFTNEKIIGAIKNAQARGVKIKGVIEKQGITNASIIYEKIENVKEDEFNRRVHTKIFVIDDEISISGAMNPTYKGAHVNDENIIIISNKKVNEVYRGYIDYVYNYQ
jgi:phospholipase D|tara:strand:+ start:600 stop:1613 length:1014 start_codon:yes stop_codon:yes gene_type:complete